MATIRWKDKLSALTPLETDVIPITTDPAVTAVDKYVTPKNLSKALDLDLIPDGTNYVKTENNLTDADKTKLTNLSGTNTGDQVLPTRDSLGLDTDDTVTFANLSGTNTGDQDLSALALKSNVLELDNTTPFTPDADYEPATKKYVDDNSGGLGNVIAPATNTDSYLPQWDGTNTKTLKDGQAIPAGGLAGLTEVAGKKPFHGVFTRPVGASNPLPTNLTTTTFTLGALANPISYYYQGTLVTVSTNKTATLSAGSGIYFVYFLGSTGNIEASKTFPGIGCTDNVILAIVTWNGSNYGLVTDERHGYNRDCEWHEWAHNTIGARYRSGIVLTASGTGGSAGFSSTSGEIADEDIQFVVDASSSFPTANSARHFYQTGASAYTFNTATSARPFLAGGANRPSYVRSDTYTLVEMTSATNRYINVFVYATSDLHTPIYMVAETIDASLAGTNGHSSTANARAVPFPNLSGLVSPEWKPIYRLVIRADGEVQTMIETDDYRTVSSLPQSAGTLSTTASAVSLNPYGTIASTNVQSAIEEISDEFVKLDGDSGDITQTNTITRSPYILWANAGKTKGGSIFAYESLGGYNSIELARNNYHNGTDWQRMDTSLVSSSLTIDDSGSMEFWTATAGSNPIANWSKVFGIDVNGRAIFGTSSLTSSHLNLVKATSGTATNEGDLVYNGTNLYFKPSGTAVDLLAGGGLTWGDSITSTSGTGITTTIANSASSGTIGQSIVIGNTQTNATLAFRISLGSSALGNIGLQVLNANASSTCKGIEINPSTTGTGTGIYFNGSGASGYTGIYFGSLSTASGTKYGIYQQELSNSSGGVVYGFYQGNISTSGIGYGLYQNIISIGSIGYGISQGTISNGTGTGNGILQSVISDSTGTGYGLRQSTISESTGVSYGWYVNSLEGGYATAGINAKFFSLNSSKSLSTISSRTVDTADILFSRTSTSTSATVSDNFNLVYYKRTTVQNGAGGTFNATGSVLKLENVATQTAGTLTDTVTVLKLVQSSISTGSHINLNPATSGTATNEGDLVYNGTNLYFKPSGTAVDLLAGGGGGITWGSSIAGTSGTGLTTTISDSASAGTIGQSIVVGNTQTNDLCALMVNTGTSTGSIVNGIELDCSSDIKTVLAGSSSLLIQCYSSDTTQSKNGLYLGINCNKSSSVSHSSLVIWNEDNASTGINTGISVRNYYTTQNGLGAGAGITLQQYGVDGTAISVTTTSNINSSTYGLVNYTLSNIQSGATTIQKIDSGTSAQQHIWADYTGSYGCIRIGNVTAPSTTTNKLYSVSGALYWNGTDLTAGGGGTESLIFAISDETTEITTGTAKITFRMPYAFTLTAVRATLSTASSSGTPTFDINEGGTTILSTKITIEANEKTSTTATTPPVISDTSLADDAEMTVDIDTAGTGAKGAKIILIGYKS